MSKVQEAGSILRMLSQSDPILIVFILQLYVSKLPLLYIFFKIMKKFSYDKNQYTRSTKMNQFLCKSKVCRTWERAPFRKKGGFATDAFYHAIQLPRKNKTLSQLLLKFFPITLLCLTKKEKIFHINYVHVFIYVHICLKVVHKKLPKPQKKHKPPILQLEVVGSRILRYTP